jgi:hypothetical protein
VTDLLKDPRIATSVSAVACGHGGFVPSLSCARQRWTSLAKRNGHPRLQLPARPTLAETVGSIHHFCSDGLGAKPKPIVSLAISFCTRQK